MGVVKDSKLKGRFRTVSVCLASAFTLNPMSPEP